MVYRGCDKMLREGIKICMEGERRKPSLYKTHNACMIQFQITSFAYSLSVLSRFPLSLSRRSMDGCVESTENE